MEDRRNPDLVKLIGTKITLNKVIDILHAIGYNYIIIQEHDSKTFQLIHHYTTDDEQPNTFDNKSAVDKELLERRVRFMFTDEAIADGYIIIELETRIKEK